MSIFTLIALVKILLLLGGLMTAAAYLVLLERWIAAWVQDRLGPNRVGIPLTKLKMFGLGQPLADGLKFIFKEEYTPGHVDKVLYSVAPVVILTAALAIFAVIPVGGTLPFNAEEAAHWIHEHIWFGESLVSIPTGPEAQRPIELVVAPGMDVGLIYVFALSSIAVYGVILGGWASNDKYSFLGGLRSSAQLIAYELPLGLGILGVVLLAGSLKLDTIITDQAKSGVWNVFVQPLGFVVFLIASFAEAARLPFDLPECEQELVGGYHTEYAGMRLLLFLIAEFLHMVTAAFLITILFLGGWHLWGLTGSPNTDGNFNDVTWLMAVLRVVVLGAKVMGVILFFMLVRWSWPRFRFDQLMNLAWKVMLPLGLVNLTAAALLVEYHAQSGGGGVLVDIAFGWVVLIVASVLAAIFSPLSTDNRPWKRTAEFDAERELQA